MRRSRQVLHYWEGRQDRLAVNEKPLSGDDRGGATYMAWRYWTPAYLHNDQMEVHHRVRLAKV